MTALWVQRKEHNEQGGDLYPAADNAGTGAKFRTKQIEVAWAT